MVDSKARRIAAGVLEKFRDGVITNFDLEGLWPGYSEGDRGLHAIETMVWRYYDDFHEHRLADDHHGLTDSGRAVFDRCVLFLCTECEYAWPDDNFATARPFSGELIELGLSDAHDRLEEARLEGLHVLGESPFWPFANRSEYECTRSAH
ncbi:hypothetical protein [uncultured Paludibaculum sp.]|uniref:hypothetical protein n=1 Tax=uncultured Paludibaculum sp. TaxID=1765020 RepID=UPI002AABDE54|nr:hypothetical protein [uncultured Paludibaculum sp.]